ncbi:MAG TPA: HD domain-containing protein [Candidatus Dormibacteraeota bacterium]|nr:HD domain-containing protein [Candidatus Dormibacteraeota bacterium]
MTLLLRHGHAAYVVGGSLRDVLLGRPAADWDLATDALPERVVAILPDSVYENAFGTVGVRRRDGVHEITTFRTDHEYADFRRPHRVEFGSSLEADLARRDFTVNAMAWGVPAAGPSTDAAARGTASGASLDVPDPLASACLVDPFAGLDDLASRRLRAVGDPAARFEEDALRMVRAVRLSATLDLAIDPATLEALRAHAELVRHLSGERIAAELEKLLAAPTPSAGLSLLMETGILGVVSPELAAQPGIAQNKIVGEDLWDHTMRTVDAAPADRPVVRLAALVHDIGKPATLAEGRFHGHEAVGARIADELLRRLRIPRATAERVVHLVRNHMFVYRSSWGDSAIRRFIKKIGRDSLEELFLLREADDVGSGLSRGDANLDELRARVREQLAAEVALDRSDLAVDGNDLMRDLGLEPGPLLGRILDDLLELVIVDPALNDRPTLLLLAQASLAERPR